MMRRSILHFHNLSFVRLLTFATVIGTQFHVLSVSATAPHFNDSATTAILPGETATTSLSTATTLSLLSAILPTSTTTTALTDSKTSKIMSNIGSGSSSSSTTTSSNSVGNSSGISVTPGGTFTATTHNYAKTTSKFLLDFSISKNHWTNTDGAAVGAVFPSSASSSLDAGGDVERPRTFRNKHHHEHHWGPFFEEPLNATTSGDNLLSTAHLFTEAVLNCRVGMLKDKTVMWVRRTTEKVSLLTVGNVTYSGDPRIRVKFQYPNNWRLLINPTQKEDAGIYMCQVSTHPPRVFTTNLTILEPPLRLIDDQEREVSDRYYKSGSTIDLQCQISRTFLFKEKLSILKSIQPQFNQSKSNTNKAIAAANALVAGINELISKGNQTFKQGQFEKQFSNFIFWTKDDELLPTATVKRSSTTEKWLNSRISVPDAKLADSGNYSCSIGKLFRAIVQVQVLTGELPAAVQHNSALSTHHCFVHPLLLHLSWICFIVAFKLLSRNISPSMRTDSKTLQTCLALSH